MKTTLLFFLLMSSYAFTAVTPTPPAGTQQTTTITTVVNKPVAVTPAPETIEVTRVCKYHSDVDYRTNDIGRNVYLGDYLMVKIKRSDLDSAKNHLKEYRLWIDGICFPNMVPEFINESEPGIIFKLERDTSANCPWELMYTNPAYWSFHRTVNMNLGTLKTEYKVPGKTFPMNLYTTRIWMPWVFYPLFILLLVLAVRYGKALLKDTSLYTSNGVTIGYTLSKPTDAATGVVNINDIPYSLSRFQFLVWLTVVFFGILHIWIITDVLTSPTGSILLLIGISSGTFYIGKLLDKTPAAGTQIDPQSVTSFINSHPKSTGLIYDMMSDGQSISLHRLQLLLFTVFLAGYFVLEVINNLLMPQFDQTMLTLMGISSATYAGIKTTESN